jgi:hypothetical protein
MRLAMYQSLRSGFCFCVVTRDAEDIKHVEKTCNLPHGCRFVKWLDADLTAE